MKNWILFLAMLFGSHGLQAQDSAYRAYIVQFAPLAIAEQQRSGVPAAIKLAQGLLESGAGTGDLTRRSNNHFGIKCKNTWTGERAYHDDDARGECFRAYETAEASYRDHSDFLRANGRYAFLFSLPPDDYRGWAEGLKKAGYATNPRYTAMLIKVIEENSLNQYTQAAMTGTDWAATLPHTPAATPTPMATTPAASPATAVPAVAGQPAPATDAGNSTYPDGYFEINNCLVLYAKAGSSLLALATNHALSLAELLEYNDMTRTDILPADQLIFVEKKKKKSSKAYTEATEGQTLWHISQREGVQLRLLQEYNRLDAQRKLAAGTKVYLQPGGNANYRSR
jgi:LysM repeat protein